MHAADNKEASLRGDEERVKLDQSTRRERSGKMSDEREREREREREEGSECEGVQELRKGEDGPRRHGAEGGSVRKGR
jgi:hypothetical protein